METKTVDYVKGIVQLGEGFSFMMSTNKLGRYYKTLEKTVEEAIKLNTEAIKKLEASKNKWKAASAKNVPLTFDEIGSY